MCQPNLTMEEIKERLLQRYDPEDLVEALDLSSTELLDRFEDKLINRLDVFEEELQDDTYNEEY
jgi:adenylate kinase family enzyme